MAITGQISTVEGEIDLTVPEPMLITEAVNSVGLVLNASCAGKGICGGCAVDLLEGTYQQNSHKFVVLKGEHLRALGCQTKIVSGPFRFFIPRRSLVETGERIVSDFVTREIHDISPTLKREQGSIWALVNGEWEKLAPDTGKCYGIAVDIGTTTVAASLVDMEKGKIVDTVTCYNQQIQKADDVIARIVHAGSEKGLSELQHLIVGETINPLVGLLCKKHNVGCENMMRMVISGNTVMWSLLLGIDPSPLGVSPFHLANRKPELVRAGELGLNILPDAPVDTIPSISAYVGGDIVSDIEVCKLLHEDGLSLLVDIGTNGEIVLIEGEKILATACAAGPAFEGLRLSNGMRASVGAIEKIRISSDGCDCDYDLIGRGKAVGICGSGMIDFLAEGLRVGILTPAGRIDKSRIGSCPRIRKGDDNRMEYIVVFKKDTEDRTHDITINEKDIETILQAKAAIYSAIVLLTQRVNKRFEDFHRIYLAGGFARYINLENAMRIGLLPRTERGKYRTIGNGSLAGAFLGLIDRSVWKRFDKIIDLPEVVELNLDPNFEEEYTMALFMNE